MKSHTFSQNFRCNQVLYSSEIIRNDDRDRGHNDRARDLHNVRDLHNAHDLRNGHRVHDVHDDDGDDVVEIFELWLTQFL